MKKAIILGSEPAASSLSFRQETTATYRERWAMKEAAAAQPPLELQWYALSVRPRFEKVVAEHLQGKGYEEYLPTYTIRKRWSDRMKQVEKPLFPGYIFCKFDVAKRLPIVMIPGVISMVSFGGRATAVPDEEIKAVQSVVNSGLSYEPCSFLSVGQRVRIERGPLSGVEGLVVQVKNNWRFIISVHLLQRSVSVEIDRDCVTPIQPGYRR
jgi:transcription antitermination factor NusG